MYRFLLPKLDGSLHDVSIGATELYSAFEQFKALYWREDMTGSWGVWLHHALVARVRVGINKETGELVPYIQEF